MKTLLASFFLFVSAAAFADTSCGIINGTTYCETATNCGYVNGIYTCSGETGFTKTPAVNDSEKLSKPGPYDAAIKDGTQWLAGWVSSIDEGEQGWLGKFGKWLVQKFVTAWIELKLSSLKFAWGVAKSVLADVGVFTALQSAWSGLSGDALSVLNFFGIPAAVNVLLNAGMTRFVMRFIPGF